MSAPEPEGKLSMSHRLEEMPQTTRIRGLVSVQACPRPSAQGRSRHSVAPLLIPKAISFHLYTPLYAALVVTRAKSDNHLLYRCFHARQTTWLQHPTLQVEPSARPPLQRLLTSRCSCV